MKDDEMNDFLKSYIDAGKKMAPVPEALPDKVWQKLQPTLDAIDAAGALETPSDGAPTGVGPLAGKWLLSGIVGAVVGASVALPVGYQWGQREERPAVTVTVPQTEPTPAEAPPKPPAEAPSLTKAPTPPLAQRRTDIELELRLIERLRTALLKQQWAAFDEAFTEHDTRFPNGQLTEERDVMHIQRWLVAGDTAQARQRFGEFQKRYPNSQWTKALEPQLDAP